MNTCPLHPETCAKIERNAKDIAAHSRRMLRLEKDIMAVVVDVQATSIQSQELLQTNTRALQDLRQTVAALCKIITSPAPTAEQVH